MFLYDALALGTEKTSIVTKFITKVASQFDTRTGNIRIGRLLYNCLDDAYNELTSPSDTNTWGDVVLPGILDLLKRLRRTGFSREQGGRIDAKSVAVLFVDGRIHNLQDVQTHMEMMSNVQFVTILVGGEYERISLRTTGSNVILTVPSYEALLDFRDRFLSHICPTLNNSS